MGSGFPGRGEEGGEQEGKKSRRGAGKEGEERRERRRAGRGPRTHGSRRIPGVFPVYSRFIPGLSPLRSRRRSLPAPGAAGSADAPRPRRGGSAREVTSRGEPGVARQRDRGLPLLPASASPNPGVFPREIRAGEGGTGWEALTALWKEESVIYSGGTALCLYKHTHTHPRPAHSQWDAPTALGKTNLCTDVNISLE